MSLLLKTSVFHVGTYLLTRWNANLLILHTKCYLAEAEWLSKNISQLQMFFIKFVQIPTLYLYNAKNVPWALDCFSEQRLDFVNKTIRIIKFYA